MKSIRQKLSYKHKNNKFLYYSLNLFQLILPNFFFRIRLHKKLAALKNYNERYIKERVNYYNKLKGTHPVQTGMQLANFKLKSKFKVYFFDTYEYTRYFSSKLRANFLFGDITHIPDEPSIIKSRPIHGDNECSVILKLNKIRHYVFIDDKKPYNTKKNMLVGRSVVKLQPRIRFFEMYFNHPMCDLGQINHNKNPQWIKEKMTLDQQLEYKFILCIEGYDVASNLKWVMSSNSLAVMPQPKYETWFMEGKLIPNVHYIQIKDDYSDLEERLAFYINNPSASLEIIKNANAFVDQFKDKKREELISLLVLEKYFYKTGQMEVRNISLFE